MNMAIYTVENTILPVRDGVHLPVRLSPGAREDEFCGLDTWRGRFHLRISAPPEKGRANRALLAFLGSLFPHAEKLEIVEGKWSRNKCVFMGGITRVQVMNILEDYLKVDTK